MGKETLVMAIPFKVSPEPPQLSSLSQFVDAYMNAVREVVFWCIQNKTTNLTKVYHSLHKHLRQKYGLNYRFALDVIRHGISIARSWLKNPRRGRMPILKTKVVWLTPNQSYRLEWDNRQIWISGIGRIPIIGWHRRTDEYLKSRWQIKEARLKQVENGYVVWVYLKKQMSLPDRTTKAIAVDMNMREVVFGTEDKQKRILTRIEDTERIHKHIQRLQRKYNKTWRRRKGVLNRIKRLYTRIRNITDDQAKQTANKIVKYAKSIDADTIILEDLNGMLENVVKKLPKQIRRKLYNSGIRKTQRWIEWIAKREGFRVEYVKPAYTSTICPYCGSRLKRKKGRIMECPKCGFKADRDVVAVLNLLKRKMGGVLTASTARGMTDETRADLGNR